MHVFFFQAEDGIRDGHVTGVQTCALPIWKPCTSPAATDRSSPSSARVPPKVFTRADTDIASVVIRWDLWCWLMCAGRCPTRARGLFRSLGEVGQVRAPALGPVGVNEPWRPQVEGGQADPGHALFGERGGLGRRAA